MLTPFMQDARAGDRALGEGGEDFEGEAGISQPRLLRQEAEIGQHLGDQLLFAFEQLGNLGAAAEIFDPGVVVQILFPVFGLNDPGEGLVPERQLCGGQPFGPDEPAPAGVDRVETLLPEGGDARFRRGKSDCGRMDAAAPARGGWGLRLTEVLGWRKPSGRRFPWRG